ncbi:hypothetical protein ACIQWR_22380 [Streptomyces sp. NPDC098789]|uniref:hypothetical protein n=1 Tax=Streptomyces sp. NPDC098789 TaxID=3366098 RepID=UPI00380E92B2
MADDRTRWLDKAAADRLLRGEPVDPSGDFRIRADAARLRDALDSLAPRAAATTELPGEAAALAAFRAAHPDRAAGRSVGVAAGAAAAGAVGAEPLVAIVPVPTPTAVGVAGGTARAPRRVGAWRLGLAAAVASVAIGGVAASAGAGLFDRALHLNAGPLPTAEVSAEDTPEPVGGTAAPSAPAPRWSRPSDAGSTPGGPHTPGPEGRATPGATGAAASGGNNGGAGGTDGTGATTGNGAGKDNREHFGITEGGGAGEGKDTLRGAADLCRDFNSGRLSGDRENRLNLLAKGRQKVQRYCDELLKSTPGTPPKGTGPTDPLPVPGPGPGPGTGDPSGAAGSLGLRLRR